jgi:hypothetical protein
MGLRGFSLAFLSQTDIADSVSMYTDSLERYSESGLASEMFLEEKTREISRAFHMFDF